MVSPALVIAWVSQPVDSLGFDFFPSERLRSSSRAAGVCTSGKKEGFGSFPDSRQRSRDSPQYSIKNWYHWIYPSTGENLADGRQRGDAIADDFDCHQDWHRQERPRHAPQPRPKNQ